MLPCCLSPQVGFIIGYRLYPCTLTIGFITIPPGFTPRKPSSTQLNTSQHISTHLNTSQHISTTPAPVLSTHPPPRANSPRAAAVAALHHSGMKHPGAQRWQQWQRPQTGSCTKEEEHLKPRDAENMGIEVD